MKSMKNAIIRSLYIIAMSVFTILATGCNEERIIINVENYVEFLNLTFEQEEEIRPFFDQVKNIVDDYNNQILIDSTIKRKKQERWDVRLQLKIYLLRELNPVISSIYEKLDAEQRTSLKRSELYFHYNAAKQYVVNNISSENAVSFEQFVSPGNELSPNHLYTGSDYPNSWTIHFGLPMNSASSKSVRNSINAGGRRGFPSSIQAILMDKTLLDRESSVHGSYPPDIDIDSLMEIRVVIASRLHENFVDINNWISFLELSNGTEIEPVKSIRRDEEWFDDRIGKLVTNNLPDFIFEGEELEEQFQHKPSPRRPAKLENHVAYYQLFFSAAVNNTSIMSEEINYIRLVFLQEIGSENRAAGKWNLEW